MSGIRSRRTAPSSHRNPRASLNPYYMDDIAFTLADIRRDRALETSTEKH